jgi:hypothetical protein
LHLAQLIVEVFPTEAAGTYYIPSEKSRNPTGKLLSSYSNLRQILASVGIIARDPRHSSNSSIQEVLVPTVEIIDATTLIESDAFESEEQLIDGWKLTHESRQKDLKSTISTSDYMGRYPFLKQLNGYELVSFYQGAFDLRL